MTQFTDTDRKFIRKIATLTQTLEKRVEALEKQLSKPAPEKQKPLRTKDKFDGDDAIEVKFIEPSSDVAGQQRLITAIYEQLKMLCDEHGIATIDIFINKQRNKK